MRLLAASKQNMEGGEGRRKTGWEEEGEVGWEDSNDEWEEAPLLLLPACSLPCAFALL